MEVNYDKELTVAPCVLDLCTTYFKSERASQGSLVIINLIPEPSVVQGSVV